MKERLSLEDTIELLAQEKGLLYHGWAQHPILLIEDYRYKQYYFFDNKSKEFVRYYISDKQEHILPGCPDYLY